MGETRIKIRANRSTGELEVEGPSQEVGEWWNKLWPELSEGARPLAVSVLQGQRQTLLPGTGNVQFPDVFGEFYSEFKSDITDIDKMLVAGAFVQGKESDRTFTTKAANQLLVDQNVKVANPSECVRRLVQAKRVFGVAEGRFRVSAGGFEYLTSLRVTQ